MDKEEQIKWRDNCGDILWAWRLSWMWSEFTLHRSEVIQQLVFPIASVAGGIWRWVVYTLDYLKAKKRILMGLCGMQLLWRQWALLGSFIRDRLPLMKQFYAREKEDAMESNKHGHFKALIITWHCLFLLQLPCFPRNRPWCHFDSFAGNFSGVLNSH